MPVIKPILSMLLILITTIAYSQVVSPPDTTTKTIGAKIFERVEYEATFPGDEEGWRKYLEKNLNAGVPVDNGAPVGKYTVYVQFVVDSTGNVSDVKALTGWGYGMEKEVIGLIKKSGRWNPAMMNGKPVNAWRKQPVTFVVEQDGFDIATKVPYVLFTGADNAITVTAEKVKSEDMKLTISQGSITATGDGRYIARVTKPGRAIIVVYGKKNKEIATVSFEVMEPAR
ncbi:MAG: energy transducer TonB [Bacteroidota bacterium]|nr:energy transducer TonB [Bacteroidota bacterium]